MLEMEGDYSTHYCSSSPECDAPTVYFSGGSLKTCEYSWSIYTCNLGQKYSVHALNCNACNYRS